VESVGDHFSITRLVRNPRSSITLRVPASTSNLGAGFDCFSLALQLYLTVNAAVLPDEAEPFTVVTHGEGASEPEMSSDENNLIFRAMRFAAEREGWQLPPVQLEVHNEIPIGRGLGSSAAAIVAGIRLASLVSKRELASERVLDYASEMEGHPDNVAAALNGGFVVSCVKGDGNILVIKKSWPAELKVIVVSPDFRVQTAEARSALPAEVNRSDAVFNLQRVALFSAALETGAYDLIWEAMKDRLHQCERQSLVPGLAEALATPPQPGLLGIALSGSGPSVVALAQDRLSEIGETIAARFRSHGVAASVRVLDVDVEGCGLSGFL
jgi:homoserine kinase